MVQAIEFIRDKGAIGSLTSRSFLHLSRLERYRLLLLDYLDIACILEMDVGLLDDATVRPCASVFSVKKDGNSPAVFFNLKTSDDWQRDFLSGLLHLREGLLLPNIFSSVQSNFLKLPNASMAYWMSKNLVQLFEELPPFGVKGTENDAEGTLVEVRQGMATGDDEKFVRQFWEVKQASIGQRWVWFAKGGSYSTYYYDLDLVLDWSDPAVEQLSQQGNKLPSREYYFQEGLTYPATSEKGLSVRYLKPGAVPSVKGSAIYFKDHKDIWWTLAVYNSKLLEGLMRAFTVDREHQVGMMGGLPCKVPPLAMQQRLEHLAGEAYTIKSAWDTGNEICTRFSQPWLLQLYHLRLTIDDLRLAQDPNGGQQSDNQSSDEPGLAKVIKLLEQPDLLNRKSEIVNLKSLLDEVRDIETAADSRLQELQAQIDEAVYDLYDISPADRALIERELGDRPPELVWPQMEGKSDKEKRREHARRLLSYFILQALKDHPTGVLPLVAGTGEATTLDLLREGLEVAFGAEAAFRLEDDAGQVLGKPVADWLDGDFSQWHTMLYNRRPVIWHVASPRGTFGALVYYHKLDRDTLPKLRNVYLRTLRDGLGRELERVRSEEDYKAVDRLDAALDDLTVLGERLERVIEAGYDPVIDNGVKANILPLQEAEVLRHRKVV